MNVVRASNHDSRVESLARIQRKRVKLQTIACGALLACATLLASSSPAMAQAGKLDSSFGVGGIFTDIANGFFSTGPFTNTQTFGTAVAVQSNGKIGLYSRIRNPIYLFGALAIAGIFLYMNQPLYLWLFVVLIPLQIYRARQEGKVLEAKFGDEYRQYKSGTWF